MRRYFLAAFLAFSVFAPVLAYGAEGFTYSASSLARFKGNQTLIAFWSADCGPCLAEQPIISAIAVQHPGLRVVVVAVQSEEKARSYFNGTIEVMAAEGDPVKLLRAAGESRAGLPYSIFLRSDGGVCHNHTGLLGTQLVDDWISRC